MPPYPLYLNRLKISEYRDGTAKKMINEIKNGMIKRYGASFDILNFFFILLLPFL